MQDQLCSRDLRKKLREGAKIRSSGSLFHSDAKRSRRSFDPSENEMVAQRPREDDHGVLGLWGCVTCLEEC